MIELQSSYNATMVVLSCLIASIASYTGLSMAIQYAAASTGRSRLAWLACGTAVMGAGIWAVCFYEINAYKWSTGIDYDYSTVLLTLAIAAASAALILRAFSRSKLRKRALLARGGIAGICAAAMPFAGLRTMRCSLAPRFDAPTIVLFALGVALMFVVILWIAHKLQSSRGPRRKAVAGVLLGTAYTAAIHIGLALTSWKSPEDVPVAIQSSSSATISFFTGIRYAVRHRNRVRRPIHGAILEGADAPPARARHADRIAVQAQPGRRLLVQSRRQAAGCQPGRLPLDRLRVGRSLQA
ncbi:MHYT domain-containing protein [Cohnella rhizosphaerae]|uniref:MHYT domain-containing protein n=1 Tax=Cohnella rhizosphaerae TaxID=1457232 RepID=A0A9X4QSY7_9BACL|nr:MHYT domain-containing protein [Cohnella rhizosphaerae]MDG0809789.1 hypothetical protein [Cohnella rhizosphaerae]